jgi:adenylosuccinate synthase
MKLQGIGRTFARKGTRSAVALADFSEMSLELEHLKESISDLTNQEQRRNSNLSFKSPDLMNGF